MKTLLTAWLRPLLASTAVALSGALSWGAAPEPEAVDRLLEEFEQRPSTITANRLMEVLAREQGVDEPVRFTARMPLDTMRQQLYYWASDWLYGQQRYEESRRMALKALPLFHGANPERADCLNQVGIVSLRLGDFSTAAHYAKECLEIDLRSGDDDLISSSMNTVAGIYMAADQPREAEKYILEALDHSSRADNPPRRAIILGMASEVYHKLGDDRLALRYAERAYSLDSMLGREPQATIRLSQKGSALLGLRRYREAERVIATVLPALRESPDRHSYAIALNNMGTAMLRQERPREAIPYYREAAATFAAMGDLYNEIHSHRGLYESYWELRPDSAKAALDRYNALKDSLYSHATAQALSRYSAEFGNDRLQQENSAMRQAHRLTLAAALLLLALTVGAAWLVLRRQRRRQQARMQKLLAEIEKLRAGLQSQARPEAAPEPGAGPVAAEPAPAGNPDDRQFLQAVIEAVNAAMADGSISVEQVAARLNMGVQSFRRRLQGASGETPKAFFVAIQMERATALLAGSPAMPVARVAELCGFDSASTFSHSFRRIYGCSPSAYRDRTAR